MTALERAAWLSKRATWEPTSTIGIFDRVTGKRRDATPEEIARIVRTDPEKC
jgi:hypothetical protein